MLTERKNTTTHSLPSMEQIQHKTVPLPNGLNMHYASLGQGPTILFLHGFPELWYTWRHQILFLAKHGYRALAPDLRGFGDTIGAPINDHSKFNVVHVVGDLIMFLDAVVGKDDKVFVVGHDWGAYVAWHMCLYRPDRVKSVVCLSVPFFRNDRTLSPLDGLRKFYGDDYYMCRFQEPGDIEAEFAEVGVEKVLKTFYAFRDPGPIYFPKEKRNDYSADRPSWLTEEDLNYYVTKFKQTGFTGGINFYRAFGLSWELNAPWDGAQVKVPAKYIAGEHDLVYHMPGKKEYIHKGGFQRDVPLLQEVVVIEGAAHFINQERPDEINELIYDFLKQF